MFAKIYENTKSFAKIFAKIFQTSFGFAKVFIYTKVFAKICKRQERKKGSLKKTNCLLQFLLFIFAKIFA